MNTDDNNNITNNSNEEIDVDLEEMLYEEDDL